MTDHEPFQREPQNPQDPRSWSFPRLLKLADRRRQALEDCRQAAEDGDANAVVQMGMNCLYGIGGAARTRERPSGGFPRRPRTTRRAFTGWGCATTTASAWSGTRTRACRLYQESAAGDYAPALCNLGVCYESGQGVEKEPGKGRGAVPPGGGGRLSHGPVQPGRDVFFSARGWRRI